MDICAFCSPYVALARDTIEQEMFQTILIWDIHKKELYKVLRAETKSNWYAMSMDKDLVNFELLY